MFIVTLLERASPSFGAGVSVRSTGQVSEDSGAGPVLRSRHGSADNAHAGVAGHHP